MIDRRLSQVCAVGLVAVSIGYGFSTLQFPIRAGENLLPGAGFYPLLLGVLMFAMGIVWLVDASKTQEHQTSSLLDMLKSLVPGPKALKVFAAIVVFAFALKWLGFLISTFILFAFIWGHVEKLRMKQWIAMSVFVSAGLFVVFDVILGVSFPKGLFGF